MAIQIAETQQSGASGSPLMPNTDKSTGHRKGQKAGKGRIFRAGIEIPEGQTAANRTDIEVLFDNLPEPIDLNLDLSNRMLYWTDRGDPPLGKTVNRAPMDEDLKKRKQAPDRIRRRYPTTRGISPELHMWNCAQH
jgi:hypothetical protein